MKPDVFSVSALCAHTLQSAARYAVRIDSSSRKGVGLEVAHPVADAVGNLQSSRKVILRKLPRRWNRKGEIVGL